MRFRLALSGCMAVLLLAGGCAAIPGFGPAPLDAFDLTAPSPHAQGRQLRGTQILVAEPSALKMLDGQDIAVRPDTGSVQFLKGVQWADRLPRIVQARLAETFQRSGRLGGVGKPGEGLAIDYQIVSDIRKFDIRLGQPDQAEVEIYVRVLNDKNGVVRAARTFTAQVPVRGGGNDAFTEALDRAFGGVANDVVDWSISVM